MRNLSQKTRYALKALKAFAREDGQGLILIGDLAEREQLPRKFLELILLDLKRRGILQSKKGRGGGYALRRAPDQITLGEVIRIFDGPVAPLPCVSETAYGKCEECPDAALCGVREVFKEVRDGMSKILDAVTVGDLVRREERLGQERRRGNMYFI
jgi:Rrf2 family protein